MKIMNLAPLYTVSDKIREKLSDAPAKLSNCPFMNSGKESWMEDLQSWRMVI